MTTYLSMNGTSDKLTIPSMTFDTIVLDVAITNKGAVYQYIYKPSSSYNLYSAINTSGNLVFTSGMTNTINGNPFTTGSFSPYNNQRITLKSVRSGTLTDGINIFNENNSSWVQGNIYDIKVYNGANLIAHYDMSTGTVQDVSGNGYNATLTGGTWLSDGTGSGGGTGTTYTGAGTSQGTSSLTPSEKVIQQASGSVQGSSSLTIADKVILNVSGTTQGNSSITSNETQILSASGTAQGSSSLTSSETVISQTGTTYSASGTTQGSSSLSSHETVILNASGSSQGTTILSPGEHLILSASGTSPGQSNLTSNETVIGHGTTTYPASGQAQGRSSLTSAETVTYSAKGTVQGLSDLLTHEIMILVASGIAQGYSTVTYVDKSNQIIGTIHLKGSQILNVNLKGGI